MARLVTISEDVPATTLELQLGVNRVGRAPECHFVINHPTVSSIHAEFILSADGILLRDCGSTNGTFINDQPITDAWLETGQEVRLGDVKFQVETTQVNIAIPERVVEPVKPVPQVAEDGSLLCARHPETQVTFQCTHCTEVMCTACVHVMRRQGGVPLYLCPVCSHKCERIVSDDSLRKKKSFFGMLEETVRLRFGGRPRG
jgi:hypothetical protein